jgi:hypothetical protein
VTSLAASLLIVQGLLAYVVARGDRSHAPVAWWSGGLSTAWLARVGAESIGAPTSAFETAWVAIAALGGWALSRRVMAGERGLLAIGVGAAIVVVGAHPELTPTVRDWLHTSAWTAGTLGASWSIARALFARRTAEPKVGHFIVLAYTALGAMQLAMPGLSAEEHMVVVSFGAAAAVAAQGAWIATRAKRRTSDVGARAEQPRGLGRGGDLVDLEGTVRGRAARRSRAEGGLGEP